MKSIELTRGMVALVDDEDFDRVNSMSWHAQKGKHTYYARTGKNNGGLSMQQAVLNAPGVLIDHKNGNGLDNRKVNLRRCNSSQNSGNTRKHTDGASRFKGVHFHKRRGRWCAMIRHKHIGLYDTEEDAAVAYDKEAAKVFGEFARMNFPKEGTCRREC